MIWITTQDRLNEYRIYYYHLNTLKDGTYEMVGLARLNLTETKFVHLGYYKFYKQAIDVFAHIDYIDNDLTYFKENKKTYYMPENILSERVCVAIYGSTY